MIIFDLYIKVKITPPCSGLVTSPCEPSAFELYLSGIINTTQDGESLMERSKKIDFFKAFAIITVVLGHSIQYGSGTTFSTDNNLLENTVFRLIYSFHMPFFMLISGYLFFFSTQKHSFRHNLISRFTSLFVPIIFWNIIPFIQYTWHDRPHTLRYLFHSYLVTMTDNCWFLWAIFFCSLVVLLVSKFFKDNILIYLIGFLITFFIPDSHNLFLYKFMYPYFLIGYFFNKAGIFIKLTQIKASYRSIIGVGSGIVFVILLYFFHTTSYIYTSKYSLIGKVWTTQFGIDIYRFMIGLIGSAFFTCILSKLFLLIPDKVMNIFASIGKKSLGIYLVSGLIFVNILPVVTCNLHALNYCIVLLETIIILFISYALTLLLSKFKLTNWLFLGGR